MGAIAAVAELMTLDVVLAPTNEIRLDYKNDSGQFLSSIQREGNADGSGVFAGAKAVEYGLHDITPGESGMATGYLSATVSDGDAAYFNWQRRAFFVAGSEGKTSVINSGRWELAGGTGEFASARGVGAFRLEFVSKTERRFVLEGDISPAS